MCLLYSNFIANSEKSPVRGLILTALHIMSYEPIHIAAFSLPSESWQSRDTNGNIKGRCTANTDSIVQRFEHWPNTSLKQQLSQSEDDYEIVPLEISNYKLVVVLFGTTHL